MKKFKNYSISKKMLTAFFGVIFIMVIIAVIGIIGMIEINKNDTKLYEQKTAPIEHLINATKSLYEIRLNSIYAVLNIGNSAEIADCEEQYQSHKETFLKESSLYRDSSQSTGSIAAIDDANTIFTDTYDLLVQNVFAASKKGDSFAATKGITQAADEVQTIFDDYDQLIANRMADCKELSDSNNATALILTIVLSVVSILGALIAVALGIKISRIISNPIKQVAAAANEIAMGQVDIDLGNIDSKDETGQLAAAFKKMVASIRQQVSVAECISAGDFTQDVVLRSDKDVLGIALQNIKQELNRTLLLINVSADQVNAGSSQVSGAAQALASGAAEQAASVEELNASVSAVEDQVKENARNVKKATDYVNEAHLGVMEGNRHMDSLSIAMNEIQASSEKISSITKVIDDIAFQTNILALNAAIEAARAGTVGKGFAVVAEEVRSLAAKSAEAAKQTAELLGSSAGTVLEGGRVAAKTAQILKDVGEKALLATKSISEIEAASNGQVNAIEQITLGLSQISAVVQSNAATAEECSASSEELAAQANTLLTEVSKFSLSDEKENKRVEDTKENLPHAGKY